MPHPTPPDLVTDRRGRERMRRVYLTALTSLASRFGSIVVLLVTVPMTLAHLGPERFGMWMVISSLGAIMAFADFGVGNGVLNMVATASGNDDRQRIQSAASSGFFILALIGALVAGATLSTFPFVRWAELFQVTSALAIDEAGQSVLIFMLCFAIGIPAGLASKVQLGLQRGYEVNAWVGLGGLLSLVTVVAATHLGAGTPVLVLALFGSQQLALILNSLVFFIWQRRDLIPDWRMLDTSTMRAILSLGGSFFLLQLVGLVAFRIDALIVAQFFGPEAAGSYAIVERLFSLITLVASVFLAPLWPAYGEALSRQDRGWVVATLRKSLVIGIIGTAVAGLCLTVLHRPLLDAWVGALIVPPLMLLIGFAVFKVIETGGNAVSMVLNAGGWINVQLVLAILMAVTAAALKLVFADGLGVASLIWFTALSYVVIVAIPYAFLVPRLLSRMVPR